jgi:hypothetical protein
MLTLNLSVLLKASKFEEDLPMQMEINGGSSETELKEFAVKPIGFPSGVAVTTVTPVTNAPSAFRKPRASKVGISVGVIVALADGMLMLASCLGLEGERMTRIQSDLSG